MKKTHSLWQSEDRERMLERSGQADTFRVDGILVEKRSIGLGMYGLFILGVSATQKIPEKKLMECCTTQKALFVQIESYSLEHTNGTQTFEYFQPDFYKKFITPYTITLDLSQDTESLLKGFHKKCQYNIRLAEKK